MLYSRSLLVIYFIYSSVCISPTPEHMLFILFAMLPLTQWINLKTRSKRSNQKGPKNVEQGFPGGAVVKNLPVSAGNMGSSPGLGRSYMPGSN